MSTVARVVGLLVAAVVLAGCFRLPIPLPTVIVTNPTPSPGSTPTEIEVSLDPTGALDVSAFDLNGFASPDGSTLCAISVDGARCDLPDDFSGTPSRDEDACPDSNRTVTGVDVTDDTEWICGGDRSASPSPGAAETTWWKGTDFPTVKRGGSTWVTLPVGKKLVAGDFLCLSTETGITCGNVPISAGFSLSRTAVTVF